MFDDFFFPYEKAKLWTRDMVILSLSNFFLYISLYIMLPVLPLWMVQHWYCSYAEEVYGAIKNGLKKKEEDIKEHGKGYEAVESVAMHLFQMPHTHRPHK